MKGPPIEPVHCGESWWSGVSCREQGSASGWGGGGGGGGNYIQESHQKSTSKTRPMTNSKQPAWNINDAGLINPCSKSCAYIYCKIYQSGSKSQGADGISYKCNSEAEAVAGLKTISPGYRLTSTLWLCAACSSPPEPPNCTGRVWLLCSIVPSA